VSRARCYPRCRTSPLPLFWNPLPLPWDPRLTFSGPCSSPRHLSHPFVFPSFFYSRPPTYRPSTHRRDPNLRVRFDRVPRGDLPLRYRHPRRNRAFLFFRRGERRGPSREAVEPDAVEAARGQEEEVEAAHARRFRGRHFAGGRGSDDWRGCAYAREVQGHRWEE
jgi:hypothetical protein